MIEGEENYKAHEDGIIIIRKLKKNIEDSISHYILENRIDDRSNVKCQRDS